MGIGPICTGTAAGKVHKGGFGRISAFFLEIGGGKFLAFLRLHRLKIPSAVCCAYVFTNSISGEKRKMWWFPGAFKEVKNAYSGHI